MIWSHLISQFHHNSCNKQKPKRIISSCTYINHNIYMYSNAEVREVAHRSMGVSIYNHTEMYLSPPYKVSTVEFIINLYIYI